MCYVKREYLQKIYKINVEIRVGVNVNETLFAILLPKSQLKHNYKKFYQLYNVIDTDFPPIRRRIPTVGLPSSGILKAEWIIYHNSTKAFY